MAGPEYWGEGASKAGEQCVKNFLILTIMDIGYVQLARAQSPAEELTNPNSLVSEADIADQP